MARLRLRPEREMIARLPDRPEQFSRYQLPVDPVLAVLHPTDDVQAGSLGGPPQLGIRIETGQGSPVTLVELEGQEGSADVLLVGQLHGITVVTRHSIRGPKGIQDHLVLYGQLGRPGPRITTGATLSPHSVIGFVGAGRDDDTPQLVLEIRRVIRPLEATPKHLSELLNPARTVAVDPRNLLPLRP